MTLRFIDLFAGLGGFHAALDELGHKCVFACEKDAELRAKYKESFKDQYMKSHFEVHDDITSIQNPKKKVPDHDILCAGFPCQPFSKSGYRDGFKDEARGTLFYNIIEIIEAKEPLRSICFSED